MSALQPNTTLQSGKYRIEKVLGQGGFGITYCAHNTALDGKVAIKEFFCKKFCDREGITNNVIIKSNTKDSFLVSQLKQRFVKEAQTNFKLTHPNIVRISDFFPENETAYYVMDFVDGESLGYLLKQRNYLPEEESIGYIKQVGSALSYIHDRKINHLDIKPDNIMKRNEDNTIVVIDFGISNQFGASTSKDTAGFFVGASDGYSPIEQYSDNGVRQFTPQTDIYALAATLYKLLTGVTPPKAEDIQKFGFPVSKLKDRGISLPTIYAISRAMQPAIADRPKDVNRFVELLDQQPSSAMRNEIQSLERRETISIGGSEVVVIGVNPNPAFASTDKPAPNHQSSARNMSKEELEETVIVTQLFHKEKKQVKAGTIMIKGVQLKLVEVPGGEMRMKCDSMRGNPLLSTPIIRETKLSSFLMSDTPVTQILWYAVMGDNPSCFKHPFRPVENVSWHDCMKFIEKVNSLTGYEFRLPTEAEWEFAARGGALSRGYKYSGSDELDNVGWCKRNSRKETQQVASKQPNELGLYDMSGNVWEWCYDIFNDYQPGYAINPVCEFNDHTLNRNIFRRVRRGGSWFGFQSFCECTYREACDSNLKFNNLGFRLVL